MDFSFKNNITTITSDKKDILLGADSITLDGMEIDMAWEYEKSGCLMYVFDKNDEKLYHFRTEGYWVAYIPHIPTLISAEALEFLGTIDVLVMPGSKASHEIVEKIEPRILVTYWELAHELAIQMGVTEPAILKYRLKEADLSSEKTWCVVMGE